MKKFVETEKNYCDICGREGRNNNAQPVIKGYCCDACNTMYVIPARIEAEARKTIYNMVNVLMSEDFIEWMKENWETIEELSEFEEIMGYYLHGMP